MKVMAKGKEVDLFKPIVIEITLETLEEVKGLYNMFNYSKLCTIQESYGLDPESIRESIRESYSIPSCDYDWYDFDSFLDKLKARGMHTNGR